MLSICLYRDCRIWSCESAKKHHGGKCQNSTKGVPNQHKCQISTMGGISTKIVPNQHHCWKCKISTLAVSARLAPWNEMPKMPLTIATELESALFPAILGFWSAGSVARSFPAVGHQKHFFRGSTERTPLLFWPARSSASTEGLRSAPSPASTSTQLFQLKQQRSNLFINFKQSKRKQ